MQDEIKLLNEKVDYLNEGNRKLHASYETRIQKLQNKLNQKETLFDQCQQWSPTKKPCADYELPEQSIVYKQFFADDELERIFECIQVILSLFKILLK